MKNGGKNIKHLHFLSLWCQKRTYCAAQLLFSVGAARWSLMNCRQSVNQAPLFSDACLSVYIYNNV